MRTSGSLEMVKTEMLECIWTSMRMSDAGIWIAGIAQNAKPESIWTRVQTQHVDIEPPEVLKRS